MLRVACGPSSFVPCFLLLAVCSLFLVSCFLLVVPCFVLLVFRFLFPVFGFWVLVSCLLWVACCFRCLFGVCCVLSVVCCLLLVVVCCLLLGDTVVHRNTSSRQKKQSSIKQSHNRSRFMWRCAKKAYVIRVAIQSPLRLYPHCGGQGQHLLLLIRQTQALCI